MMSKETLIHNVQIFDGQKYLEGHWSVLIKDKIIKQIMKINEVPISLPKDLGEEHVIDGTGCTLLPGLIDLHVHLTWDAGHDPASTFALEPPEETLLRATYHCIESLHKGITTVRDLGSVNDHAIYIGKAVEKGWIKGSRVVAAGRSIIMTGGHDPFHGIMIDGPYEALKAVRLQAYKGAGVIKVSETGGVYGKVEGETVEGIELLPEELKVIADQAHRMGLKVAAHCIGEEGITNCIDAGIDSIEHGHFLTHEQAERMVSKGIALVPTVCVYKHLAESEDIPEYTQIKARAIVERHKKALNYAREAGVLIGAGSDAGSPGFPHPSLFEEIECLVDYGFTSVEALTAATFNAAKILGMENLIGKIYPGCRADLILVNGNPTADIKLLRRIKYVFKDGVLI